MVHIPVLLTHNAFLEANSFSPWLKVWIANTTVYRLAPTTGPPLCPTLTTHTFTHTAHHMNTDSAGVTDITSVTWLPGGPHTRKLAWWAAGAPLLCEDACSLPHRWLTFADGRFSCPFHICFTRPVLGAGCEEKSRMAGVHQGVTEGGEIDRSHVRVGWRLGLSAGVGWNSTDSIRKHRPLFMIDLAHASKEIRKYAKIWKWL